MLSMSTDPVAALTAAALKREAAASSAHRRMYLGQYLGVEPADIFEVLMAESISEEVVIGSLEKDGLMGMPAGDSLLIPYLVTSADRAGVNRGSEGYAALLRSRFRDGSADGEKRVLLVLHQDPVETIKTAAEDAATLPGLSWPRMCRAAAALSQPASLARDLIEALASDLGALRSGTRELLAALAKFAMHAWASQAEAGGQLHTIGIYVADPHAGASDLLERLNRSRRWRADLDRWSEPGSDLEAALRKRFGEAELLQTILDAVGPAGIDYSAFTLEQLEAATKKGTPSVRRPLRGFKAAMTCINGFAVWLPEHGGELVFQTTGRLTGSGAELNWTDGDRVIGSVSPEVAEVAFRVSSSVSGWRFGTVQLRRGRSIVAMEYVAAYFAEGSWFPVEGSRNIDPDRQAFVVEAEASAYLVSAPRNLGRIDLDTSGLETEQRITYPVVRNLEEHPLPIILRGESSEQGPTTDGSDQDTDEENGPEGPTGQGEAIAVRSPVHAMLHARSAELTVSERGDPAGAVLEMSVATVPYQLQQQTVAGHDGALLERQILAQPDVWTFTLTSSDPAMLRADLSMERLSMEGIDREALALFSAARATFFERLAPYGSAYAAGETAVHDAAIKYVDAYQKLLASLPERGRSQPEFDRCLLIDAVAVPGIGERYIAPTNPLTVAFYLTLWSAGKIWCSADPGMLSEDVDSLSSRNLLPFFAVEGRWYESAPSPAFLWRRYQPVAESVPGMTYDNRFIAKKLDFFLKVHPAYRDPRQTIRVCVFEPGDGVSLVGALRRFYEPDLKTEASYTLPRLDLHIVSEAGTLPPAITELLAEGQGRPIERLVRSRVRITVTRADVNEPYAGMPQFAHLTFVHRSNAERRPGPVEVDGRASTYFVGGLAAAAARAARPQPNGYEFFWGVFGSRLAGELPDRKRQAVFAEIATKSLELVGGQPREMLQSGVTRMMTTNLARDFMVDVYERSIWVVHLERLIGLELFAPDFDRPQRYLIDYEESFAGQAGVDGITATEHVAPYHKALRQALEGFDLSPSALDRLLNLLNAVEGSWALQLLHSSAADILARVGVVAATALLQDLDRAFSRPGGTGVLLPMEELLDALPASLEKPEVAKSDDLLYLWLPHGSQEPWIRARAIEVKFSSHGGPDLTRARQQLKNTCDWLEETFNSRDPQRLFRARDLAELIRAAAARNSTFGLAPNSRRTRELEEALTHVASGHYRFEAGFWVGSHRLRGDVISVEMESGARAVRTAGLPGAGEAFGLVRLGGAAVSDIADDRPLSAEGQWEPARFEQPEPDSPPLRPEQPSGRGTRAAVKERVAGKEVQEEVRRIARELDAAVIKYGLELEPFRAQLAQVGPSVIRFRSRPLGKQALEGIARRAADLGREVGVPEGVLIGQEPYYVTVDVPRRERQLVLFSDYKDRLLLPAAPGALKFLLGVAPSGEVTVEDIARLPHLLIAGATGSGKSILLRSILCSLLLNHPPQELRIFLVDTKQIDFLPFEDVPHLVNSRIVFDSQEALADLAENIEVELARRRPILKRARVTNALDFYEAGGTRKELPQMVIMVDEFADLASALDRSGRDAFMSIIQRYGQLTRAFGIYLVLATQRPSVQVITGDIKANLTARVALKLLAPQDSMTILGHAGAESLRDKGDLIFEHAGRRERLQGFFVRSEDIAEAVDKWRGHG